VFHSIKSLLQIIVTHTVCSSTRDFSSHKLLCMMGTNCTLTFHWKMQRSHWLSFQRLIVLLSNCVNSHILSPSVDNPF